MRRSAGVPRVFSSNICGSPAQEEELSSAFAAGPPRAVKPSENQRTGPSGWRHTRRAPRKEAKLGRPRALSEEDEDIRARAEDRVGADALQEELKLRPADVHLLTRRVVALPVAPRKRGNLRREGVAAPVSGGVAHSCGVL